MRQNTLILVRTDRLFDFGVTVELGQDADTKQLDLGALRVDQLSAIEHGEGGIGAARTMVKSRNRIDCISLTGRDAEPLTCVLDALVVGANTEEKRQSEKTKKKFGFKRKEPTSQMR